MKQLDFYPCRVRESIALILIFIWSARSVFAQQTIPIIKATAPNVRIKDGYVIREGIWNLSPESNPDVYNVLEPQLPHPVTFYTDIDSITVQVFPGSQNDFVVLLNGKDTCYTRISAKGTENAVSGANHLLSPEKQAMDYVVLRDYLKSEHPGLYRYKARERLKTVFDSCLLSIQEPETRLQFAKKVLFTISEIQDGHTGSNISSLLVNSYLESKLFPLSLYFIDNKAFVSCANSEGLPIGTEVLSINKLPVIEVRNQLFKYLPSDGSIETKKNQTLNNNGAFPFLYGWIFGFSDSFLVSYKSMGGRIKSVHIRARVAREFECETPGKQKHSQLPSLKYLENDVALLTIKTFDKRRLPKTEQYFDNFLVKSFSELNEKNVENLIIDLRDNAGGNDEYGPLLYSYLTSEPFRYYESVESTRKIYTKEENALLATLPAQAGSFRGHVYILINGLSFSVTAEFCAVAKSNARATFVGEETGGGYYGNTSGQTMKIELPNSGIQVVIPRFKYANAVKRSRYADRGIIPDYPIHPDVHEYVKGDDVVLQFALNLISRSAK
jgi:hypothetical protein